MGKRFPAHHKHILLACFPKSGSSFLAKVISGLPYEERIHELYMGIGGTTEEQEMNPVSLMLYHQNSYVSQQHVRYSLHTKRCIDQFGMKPLFLIRNKFDVIVSINDHWFNEGFKGPQAYIRDEVLTWQEEARLDFIVDLVVPWYVNSFMSWTDCEDKLLLTYEELMGDKLGSMGRIADFCEISSSKEGIAYAIQCAEGSFTRKNVGISGRGELRLSSAQKARVKRHFSYYKGVDFSLVGI